MHFLQSPAWQDFQTSLGRKTFRRDGEGWSYLAILEPGKFGTSRLYCPYGPTVDSPRTLKTALDSLRALASSQGAMSVRIEPIGEGVTNNLLEEYGLKYTAYSSPSETWCIDLTQPEETLLATMKQNTRNIYRNYSKKGLAYSTSTDSKDIKHLTRLLHGVASHNQIAIHNDNYFKKQAASLMKNDAATLHFISFEKEIIAAALTYYDNTTTYYAHAAADHEHRKLGASTALLAEIIMNAKRDGKQTCDLYGITTSSDPNHRWAGFTKFKQSFGGYLVQYTDTYELPVQRARFTLYSGLKYLKRLVN